jgi:hypothetical protein
MPDCVTPSDHVTVHGAVPVSDAWIVAEEPAQTEADPLTAAVGRGLTVTVTAALFVETHPLASVTVSVYVLVKEGEATGEQLVASESPVAGVHEQLVPPDPVKEVEFPAQIVAVPDAAAIGSGLTVTVALPDDVPGH